MSPVAHAACCCELFALEAWDVLWCENDTETTAFTWSGIPSDASMGACANWVRAGTRPEHGTITMTEFNDAYGSNVQNCSSLFGAESNDCATADAILKSFYGGDKVECLTPEMVDDQGGVQLGAASSSTLGRVVAGLALLVTVSYVLV